MVKILLLAFYTINLINISDPEEIFAYADYFIYLTNNWLIDRNYHQIIFCEVFID